MISLFAKLRNKYFREFIEAWGREPQTTKEWMTIQDNAVRELNKTKGVPQEAKPDWHTGWTPKVIQGSKKEGIESLLKSGDVKKGVAPKTTKETLKAKKDRGILLRDADEDIARIKRENKQAVEDFKKKQVKKKDRPSIRLIKNFERELTDIELAKEGYNLQEIGILKRAREVMKKEGQNPDDALSWVRSEMADDAGIDFEDFMTDFDWGDFPGKAEGGRIGMMGGGPLVKGGKWFLKSLHDTKKQIMQLDMPLSQKQELIKQADDAIKYIEDGGAIPEQIIQHIRKDPKFRSVHQTRSADPDLAEMEEVILNYGKKGDVVDDYLEALDKRIMDEMDLTKSEMSNMSSTALDDLRRNADPVGMHKHFDEITPGRGVGDFPDEKQTEILEQFDVTDQTKHADGGRIGMMYGGDPGFAFEYGGSWADWHDQHRDTMPVEQYIQTKLPKERLPFRQMQSGGLAYMLGEPTYMKYSTGGSVGHAPWHKPTGHKQPEAQQETPTPHVAGTPDPLKAPRGIPSLAPKNMDPAYMQQQMMQKAMMGQGPRPMAKEGGLMRMGFKKGGDMSRRGFLKLIAGLAALPVVGKYFKLAKPAAKAVEAAVTMEKTAGMPTWFPALVNRIIKEGDDVTKTLGTAEREIVHTKKISAGEEVTVYRNLDTGNVRVEYGPSRTDAAGKPTDIYQNEVVQLEYRAPEEITSGKHKGTKTKSEFEAAESEPEVVNWDGDIEWSGENVVGRVEDLVADTNPLKQFATKKKPTMGEIVESSKKNKYRQKLQEDTMEQIDYIENKRGPFPDPSDYSLDADEMAEVIPKWQGKASGGLAGLLGE